MIFDWIMWWIWWYVCILDKFYTWLEVKNEAFLEKPTPLFRKIEWKLLRWQKIQMSYWVQSPEWKMIANETQRRKKNFIEHRRRKGRNNDEERELWFFPSYCGYCHSLTLIIHSFRNIYIIFIHCGLLNYMATI